MSSSSDKISKVFESAVASNRVAGAVALVANADEVLFEAAFGAREIGGSAAMSTDTVFWIASMTKAITTTAALQMVEQGKLELDADLGKLLPELASVKVLDGFDASGEPRLRDRTAPITLLHLLTHTSGFSYDIWNADIGRYMEANDIPGVVSCENKALTTPLVFQPGESWEYGIGIDWAGKAVEKVSGLSLKEYFQKHLFGPLGMSDTGFVMRPDQRERLSAMHARGEDNTLSVMPFEVPQSPEFFMGGGGLYSVGADYVKFMQMILNEGRGNGAQVLKAETVAQMRENQIGDINVQHMPTNMPPFSNDAEFFPGMVKKWGLGFMLNTEQAPTGRSAGSLTWAGLANTYYWIDPSKQIAGVILAQVLPFVDHEVMKLYADFETAAYETLT